MFNSNDKLSEHLLLKLHNDNYIALDEPSFKKATVDVSFGYKQNINFKFHNETNSDSTSLDNMLNTAFIIKNGLERKTHTYSKIFSPSHSHEDLKNLNILDDTSNQINMKLQDESDDIFQRYFTKTQVVTSVIQTLSISSFCM